MIENAEKIQSMKKEKSKFKYNIDNMTSEKSNSGKLNGISRLRKLKGKYQMQIINNFNANFNYCLLVWHFYCSKASSNIK